MTIAMSVGETVMFATPFSTSEKQARQDKNILYAQDESQTLHNLQLTPMILLPDGSRVYRQWLCGLLVLLDGTKDLLGSSAHC